MNGHNLLAYKLRKKGIPYHMYDNAFLDIYDVKLLRNYLTESIRKASIKSLDAFAKRYYPVA